MEKRLLQLATVLIFFLNFNNGCVGDKSFEVRVQVFDLADKPIEGAQIYINGEKQGPQTDADGATVFPYADALKKNASTVGVRVVHVDYMESVQQVDIGKETNRLVVSACLKNTGTTEKIDPAQGGTVTTEGATVQIAPNSFVNMDGTSVTQQVDVGFTYIAPNEDLRAAGNFRINDNEEEMLLSLGLVGVQVTVDGNPVELAPGTSVTLVIPADSDGGTASAPPPIWSADTTSGAWAEGNGQWTQTTDEWEAQVDAIATWNCDYPSRVSCVTGTLTTMDGAPMGGVAISGAMTGQTDGVTGAAIQTATTGSDGNFCMEVIPESQLSVSVMCPGGNKVSIGSMTVPNTPGARCGSEECSELGNTQVPCCFNDQDCPQDEQCLQGECTGQDTDSTLAVVTGECLSDSDCAPGEACESGICLGEGVLRFTLTWDAEADYDLHVVTPAGTLIGFWGSSSAEGGEWDVDNTSGGPGSVENIYFDSTLSQGSYQFFVNNFSEEPGSWTITVYQEGAQVRAETGSFAGGIYDEESTYFTYSYSP